MKLHLNPSGNQRIFTGYGTGYVSINGERHEHSVVVMAGQLRTDWNAASFDSLTESHFSYFLSLAPEIVLLGTGPQQHFALPRLYQALSEASIAIEFMNTAAACRTYNILVAENRHVIAAVLMR